MTRDPATAFGGGSAGAGRSGPPMTATIVVSHSSALVSAGLAAILRGIEGCDVRMWNRETDLASRPVAIRAVVVDDLAVAAQISTECAARPGFAARLPKVLLLAAAPIEVDPVLAARAGVSACLSVDCREDELLHALGNLLDENPPGGRRESSRASAAPAGHAPARAVANPCVHGAVRHARGGLAPGALRRIRQHIEASLAERIGLADLAAIAGLSECHVSRAFKQSIGVSPQRYITMRRVAAAAELIRGTDRPLTDVSLQVGFCDQSHFTRTFARMTGETPHAFRRRHR